MTGVETGPVFIGGLSGSGKTQLRMVLGVHPDVSLTRRTRMWDRFYGRFGDLRDPANLDRCLSAMLGDPGVQQLAPDERRVRGELADGPCTYARLFGLLHQHHAERLGKRRWGDQLGFVERFADPIFATFPSARMVHMVRDPRQRPSAGGRGLGCSAKVGSETAMWLRSAELAERNRRLYRDGYLVVRYETFSAHPAETADAICSFVGERFLPPMADVARDLRFGGGTGAAGAGIAPAARPAADTAFLDRYAGRELARFGYPRAGTALSGRDRLVFRLAMCPLNRLSMVAWRVFGAGGATAEGW
jgi:Sulfotransferase family